MGRVSDPGAKGVPPLGGAGQVGGSWASADKVEKKLLEAKAALPAMVAAPCRKRRRLGRRVTSRSILFSPGENLCGKMMEVFGELSSGKGGGQGLKPGYSLP